MRKKNIKISYDRGSKVLSVEVGRKKSVDSDVQGNVVMDYDKDGRIARINLYDFSFDSFRENRRVLKNFARAAKAFLAVR